MTARFKLLSIFLLSLVALSALANPSPVRAALGITVVNPGTVVNNIATTITVTGTDFPITSIVRLTGTALATTYVSDTSLTAVVPLGFAPGVYDVEVEDPGVTTVTLPGGLTVLAPTPTPTLPPFARPQIVIESYDITINPIVFGQQFNLNVSLDNAGSATAYGVQVILSSFDLLMLKNGGVIAVGTLGTVGSANFSQTVTAAQSVIGKSIVSVDMTVSYYDGIGTPFTEKFTIYVPVSNPGSGRIYPTATPTGVRTSQLVITHYETDVDPLQPGGMFKLGLTVQNVGTIDAKSVTMIVGGGSSSGSGTPQAGVSAGSGEFTNFAPVGTSNVQLLGNIAAGTSVEAEQQLIVNVSTNPGAYPMKISFVYSDANGNSISDEQVITLLVYRLPQVEIGFYQPVGELYAGQPGMLPLQIVNLGRSTTVLGMMTVETTGGTMENAQMLVGALDMGGYFPLDAIVYPDAPGTLELLVTIDYTDDFNQPRSLTQTLTVEVFDMPFEPIPDPNAPLEPVEPQTDGSFWQKLWRFILGLLGLDSGVPAPEVVPSEVPFEILPAEPAPAGGKG